MLSQFLIFFLSWFYIYGNTIFLVKLQCIGFMKISHDCALFDITFWYKLAQTQLFAGTIIECQFTTLYASVLCLISFRTWVS